MYIQNYKHILLTLWQNADPTFKKADPEHCSELLHLRKIGSSLLKTLTTAKMLAKDMLVITTNRAPFAFWIPDIVSITYSYSMCVQEVVNSIYIMSYYINWINYLLDTRYHDLYPPPPFISPRQC